MSDEGPTIKRRMQPGIIVVSTDAALAEELRSEAGEDWRMLVVNGIDEAGDWSDVLLYRFIIMDLENGPPDPPEEIRRIRQELMINTPVFGVGGSDDIRGRARQEGGDRFFDRDQARAHLPDLLAAFGW